MIKLETLKQWLLQSPPSWNPLILRLFLGAVLFPHGMQKLFGWFGGPGFQATLHYLTESQGLPRMVGIGIILIEGVGSVALLLGFMTRIFALSFAFLAIGIVLTTHLQYGFFMNWYGTQKGEGIEYFLLWIGMSLALSITGGGRYAVDRLLYRIDQDILMGQ